jgi:PPK2 family polyphosphate:nucleotide phosphotransferase
VTIAPTGVTIAQQLRVAPGTTPDLAAIDPDGTPGFDGDKAAGRARLDELRDELTGFQERLWAEGEQSLLIVLQALDAGGKDGLIRKVITAFNPQGTRVVGFGVPTEEELRHDFLWRVHAVTPGKGRIGVFNRSHYEDVLVVRVKELVPESVWRDRYERINDFEATLAASGTRIVKLFLHISRDEQRARFQKRLDNPEKHWKWDSGDLETREKWADFQAAYADALGRCSTDVAPWFVIPANRKWYRDLAAAEILAETARAIDPRWPQPTEDVSRVVIPD